MKKRERKVKKKEEIENRVNERDEKLLDFDKFLGVAEPYHQKIIALNFIFALGLSLWPLLFFSH